MPDGETYLRVELKNTRPVELVDLTASLMALGQWYEDYASSHGYDPIKGNVRLYVRELRTGSVVADLQPMLDQVSFVIEHRDLFIAFLANFNDFIQFFLASPSRREIQLPSRTEAERLLNIMEPTAKDGGSQLFLQVMGDVNVNTYNYTSEQANTVQNQARRYLGPHPTPSQFFHYEPLTLFQVRDDPKGTAGDKGIIERFSDKPVRLRFMDEEAKRAVLESTDNPLRLIFFVDGEMSTAAGGKPAVYKIHFVHGHEARPDSI